MSKITARIVVDDTELERLMQRAAAQGKVVKIIADGVHYGVYQEFGTRYMAGKPFLTPAVEHVRPALTTGWKKVIESNVNINDFMTKIAMDAVAFAKAVAPVDTGQLRASIHLLEDNLFIGEYEVMKGGKPL